MNLKDQDKKIKEVGAIKTRLTNFELCKDLPNEF
jgi:hypothetical protein